MKNELTDRAFWESYWEKKKNLILEIPQKNVFFEYFKEYITNHQISSSIELGGFPGFFGIYFKKYFNLDVTILDYFVHYSIIHDLLKANHLQTDAIQIIEEDLFSFTPTKKYDLVCSFGLIEHFEDTNDIIEKHIPLLSESGSLLITLPNFKSINGWFQKHFDHDNYSKHNIDSMDISLLKEIAIQLGLKNVECHYYGKFGIWIENESNKSFFVNLLKKCIWIIGKTITKLIPFESKMMSPYIILSAQK